MLRRYMHRLVLASVMMLVASGCRGLSPKSHTSEAAGRTPPSRQALSPAHAALVSELERLQERGLWLVPPPVHLEQVRFAELPSGVVPGLRYHYAIYRPPEITHGFYYVVAGERLGRLEILREAVDWGVLTRDWRPPGAAEATSACLEIVNAVTPDDEPIAAASRRSRDSLWVAQIADIMEPSKLRRVQAALASSPEAEHRSGHAHWTVRTWVAQRRSRAAWLRRYECTLPAGSYIGPGATTISVVDSVPVWLPDR